MNDPQTPTTHRQHASVKITVSGSTEASLIANTLREVFRHTDDLPADSTETDGEIIGFRATGTDLSHMLADALRAALDEADAQRVTIRGVDVAGLMPIDEGMRCWGYLATSARSDPRPTCTIDGVPTISRNSDQLHAEFSLRIER